ncbi:MAG: nitroreductase/quinone reductase family protein [Pseudomonadales bacterium]|nr:nitroreductase/quinone reductase family protein [Pseudomonadales bacterium]
MKLPDPLFVVVNPLMALLLRSPLHSLLSGSLMLITFTGRRSGRSFMTPVRYICNDGIVRCFTSSENQWSRNLRGGSPVTLRISGQDLLCEAKVTNDPENTRKWLVHYLRLFPQDAVYHDIRVEKGQLNVDDLELATKNAIVIEAKCIDS